MIEEIVVPKLGLTMTEATVGTWFVAEGDKVSKDDDLVEIETDKISHTIIAPCDGVVETIVVPVDDTVPVGTVLCTVRQ